VTQAILFDLDGTLVDSYPGIAEAYRYTFDALQLKTTKGLDMHQFVGPSIREVLADHFGMSGTSLEEGIRIFRSHYGTTGLFRFTKYDGIEDVLRRLKNEGYSLHIATSKLWTMAEQVIVHAGWREFFTTVGGSTPDGSRYLKRDVIAWTLAQIPPGVTTVAMIGDRAADIAGGRGLGLRTIGVAWGYGSRSELSEAGADEVVTEPGSLLTALRTSP
jgi:phosphoglycolate phosphatase